ncbi:MAG: TrmH family RNA methyltransferase, partial [Pseudomonadota bacterium]|nr:TrmH family RNA methyltransferase [Pseudomonadota bacterium]
MLIKLMIDTCNSNNLSLAVFQPDIAQNLGAMLRLTACFGVSISIIEPCGFPFSQKVLRRSAMDYMDFAKINHHTSYKDFREKTSGRVILLTTKAKKSIWEHSFKNNDTLLVGQES